MKVVGIKFFVVLATICTVQSLFGQDQTAPPKDPADQNAAAPRTH